MGDGSCVLLWCKVGKIVYRVYSFIIYIIIIIIIEIVLHGASYADVAPLAQYLGSGEAEMSWSACCGWRPP